MHKLWARIKGKDYPIAYGSTITDTFSETLDSATVILPYVKEVIDIKPYDDVIIHSDEYDSSSAKNVIWCKENHSFQTVYTEGKANALSPHSIVYRHMLCENPQRKQLNFNGEYTYTLSCVSETKGLEFAQMPNRTITQPKVSNVSLVSRGMTLDAEGGPKSILYWIMKFVGMYSPKIKRTTDGATWRYSNQYVVGSSVISKFALIKCPEMTFQGSTLREALTQLMNVLDCIPVVRDNVIGFLDLSQRNAKFSERRAYMRAILAAEGISEADMRTKYPSFCEHEDKDQIPNQSWNNWAMSGGEFADRLRTEYSGAISEQNSTRYVEKKGFRNMNTSSMKMSDLRIELSHPIYKINKIYLEYYKKDIGNPNYAFLVKYDITPLVKLNSERQMLSHDWTELAHNRFDDLNEDGFVTIEDFAQYYFFTIGYNIGSTSIDGWGETLNFSKDGVLSQSHSTLENIIVLTALLSYYGGAHLDFLPMNVGEMTKASVTDYSKISSLGWNDRSGYSVMKSLSEYIVTPAGKDNTRSMFLEALKGIIDWFSAVLTGTPALSDYAAILKSVFFEIDYEGMISGAVISTKDYHDGRVVRRDAVSSSLPVIELAGTLEKQKANKLGNAVVVTSQRVDRREFLMQIGDYDKDDQIIYQRTVSYNRDYLRATYYQSKDFTLKNYYTSVSAKIRPFSLSSYGEAVTRNENHYEVALFSTKKHLYQSSSKNFSKGFSVNDAISFMLPNAVYSWQTKPYEDFSSIVWKTDDTGTHKIGNRYLLERQNFISGNSLCLTFTMPDSVSMGTYIKNWNPSVIQYLKEKYNFSEDVAALQTSFNEAHPTYSKEAVLAYENNQEFLQELSGTIQAWHMIQNDIEPIHLCFSEVAFDDLDKMEKGTVSDVNETFYPKLMEIPKLPYSYDENSERIKFCDFYKDQKERLNSTAQLELVSDSDDIFVTEWAARLSDANGAKKKAWAYKKDSVVWFWVLQTAYVVDGEKTPPVRFASNSHCGYMYETSDDTYIEGVDFASFATTGWGRTNVSNPCISFPVILIATNTESDEVINQLATHDQSNPVLINQTIYWGSYYVKLVSAEFNSSGLATYVTIEKNGVQRRISMMDLNGNSFTGFSNVAVSSYHSYSQNSARYMMYESFVKFNIMTIRKSNGKSEADLFGSMEPFEYVGDSIFSKFVISQSTAMWLPEQTLNDFIVNSESVGNTTNYPVFMYVKYALIHLGYRETAQGITMNYDFTDKADPLYCTADYAVANMAFGQFGSSYTVYDQNNKFEQRNRVFVNGHNEDYPNDFAYASDRGNVSNSVPTGSIKTVYISIPNVVSIGSGTLTITNFWKRIDAREAESLIACNSIPPGEVNLNNVEINGQSAELSNREHLLNAIADGDLTITAEGDVSEGGSIRVYYKDSDEGGDGMTHLVFAINDYSVSNGVVSAHIYVSILDDRTETVIDQYGEPSYRVANFAEDDFDSLGNYCVAKSSD